jgi:FkbM family methyltransferase
VSAPIATDTAGRPISYAQRFEDFYLARCFDDQPDGFYIDVGAGHPIVDNVSFAFYQRGWRGITAEPNPRLAELTRAVRVRDHVHQGLIGAAPGEATFHLVEDFHGFSTTVAAHAETARAEFGKNAEPLVLPVTTLAALCARHAPPQIDFLKIDVEGAEKDVLLGADWQTFRPRIVLAEALAPYTLAPAFADWEPILIGNGYHFAFFDSLNRYYVADEALDLAARFPPAPLSFESATQVGLLPPALDESHPDGGLARRLATAALTRLPLLDRALLVTLMTADLLPADLASPAGPAEIANAWERVLGVAPSAADLASLALPPGATLAQAYGRLADSDVFRLACGRISASYAW